MSFWVIEDPYPGEGEEVRNYCASLTDALDMIEDRAADLEGGVTLAVRLQKVTPAEQKQWDSQWPSPEPRP